MKKILLKLMTVILAVAMITGTLASCALFEIDNDRDLERAVAVVNIDKGLSKKYGISGEGENIYKRELIAGYISYGYMYVQSYGYTPSDAYSLILDNLINNKIIMQYARGELAKNSYELESKDAVIDAIIAQYGENMLAVLASDSMIQAYNEKWTKGKKDDEIVYGSKEYLAGLAKEVKALKGKAVTVNDPLFRFLDYDAVLKSVAGTIDSVNSLIETFMEEDDVHEHENIAYTVRTTPTMDEEDPTDEEKAEENKKLEAKAIKLDTKDRKVALAKAYERFIDLGLIDTHEKYEVTDAISILNLTYFRSALLSTLESEVITKFEDYLRDEHSLKAPDEDGENDAEKLWASYLKLAETQKGQYENDSASLESALSAISDSTFVTYNPGTGYGYVSHFLVQFEEETKAKIAEDINDYVEEHGAITAAKKQEIADSYVSEIVARDLRASWVQSGYGVLEGNQTIRFTDDYVYTDVLAYYNGTYERAESHEEEDEDGNTLLSFNYFGVKPNDISYSDFNTIVNSVIGETVVFNTVGQVAYNDELKNRFEDLKFAFSTDEGNFNSYLGYLYSPETSATQYVSAFATAAQEVCAMGAGAYKMFVSEEYGLHIVLCTKMVNELIYTLDDAGRAKFVADLAEEGTVAYNFLEATNALLENSVISKLANTYIQQGLSVEGVVVKNEKVYKDLIQPEEK